MNDNSTCASNGSNSESGKADTVCKPIISMHETDVFKRHDCHDVYDANSQKKTQLVVLSAGNYALYNLFSQSPFTDSTHQNMHDMITPRSKEWRNEVARCAHFLANKHPGEECIFFNDT